uniref:Uncharacterized protein n=1 Tax=Poecilia reticulata TaxID=8081 RepID=A0A3P9PK64_POERE
MSLGKAVRSFIKPARGLLASSEPALKRSYAAVAEARAVLEHELDSIRAAGTWKAERIITSKQGPQINVEGSRGSERRGSLPPSRDHKSTWKAAVAVSAFCLLYPQVI